MGLLSRYSPAGVGLFLLLWAGCHHPDNYVFTSDQSPRVDQLFTLSAAGDTLMPADGFSAVELVARVMEVSEGLPAILFTTTAGSLRLGAIIHPDSAIVPVNGRGEARIELVSASREATAQVRAAVMDVQPLLEQALRIHFKTVAHDDMLVFVEAPDSAFAQGLSLAPFTVRIAATLTGDERQVRFEATQGFFPFSLDEAAPFQQVQVVRADAQGLATAYLRTPEQAGEALVRATVGGFLRRG